MPRYLTPSKVVLLALVTVYCESAVPNRSLVAVLSFILSKLLVPTADTLEHASEPIPENSELSAQDFDLALRSHPSIRPGRSLYDLLLNQLWSIDSLHALHEFFGSLESYLSQHGTQNQEKSSHTVQLSRTSPLGIFIRRAQVEFTRLIFDETSKLWIGFLKFRAPTEGAWRKKNNGAVSVFDSAITEFDIRNFDRLSVAAFGSTEAEDLEGTEPSTEDVERLLEFGLERLQRFGSRVPKVMQERIKTIIAQRSETPHASYFVGFFDSWRSGDFTGAFENLHRYFDYTVRTRDKSFYQYALLHMAILQADFGCFGEAVAAMNETIATARENQDTGCLDFALSWLSHLSKSYPHELKQAGYSGMHGPEKDRLVFLAEKAKESKDWSLLSSTLLSESKLSLSLGGDPLSVCEHLYQSAHLNLAHHIFGNCGTQLLIESALFARTGLNMLADNNCELILDCYANRSPLEDTVRAICRRAQVATQSGQYARAGVLLENFDADVFRILRLNQYIVSVSGLSKLRQSLRAHDLVAAEHILQQLKAGAWRDPDTDFQIAMLEIDFLTRNKSLHEAFEQLEDLLDDSKENQVDIVQQIMLLLVKADLLSRAGKAGKGFTIVLRAASLAHRSKLFPLLWEACGALANVLSFFGEFSHAAKLMDAALPQALGAGDISVAAVLYARQADAHMGLTGASTKGSRDRAVLLSKTEAFVDRALGLYEKLQDVRGQCEMLTRKAVIARLRGDLKLAEDWATKYLTLYDRHFGPEQEKFR